MAAAAAAATAATDGGAVGGPLPTDAVRHILAKLDWRSLCTCSAVCQAWRDVAEEDGLWQQQLTAEFGSPFVLAQSLVWLADAGAAGERPLARLALAAGSSAAAHLLAATTPPSQQHSQLKQVFAAATLHPAAAHQAYLARCQAALGATRGWRLVIQLPPLHWGTAKMKLAALAGEENLAAADGFMRVADAIKQRGVIEPVGGHNTAATQGAVTCGHPSALTLEALLEAGGWACGAVHCQEQQQSCWVHFNLPPELKDELEVAELVDAGLLSVTLQALGPSGWFDVHHSSELAIPDDDMDVLLQSHRTGLYVWDHSEEGPGAGIDRYGTLQPQPWDLGYENAPASRQQQQQQQQPRPQLRMLAYVHYEQLLRVLPWPLPQRLPLRPLAVRPYWLDVARRLRCPGGRPTLWLQLDFCRLHGGDTLGSICTPLALAAAAADGLCFDCDEQQLMVVLYDALDGSTPGGSKGDGTAAPVAQPAPAATPAAGTGAAAHGSASVGQQAAAAAGAVGGGGGGCGGAGLPAWMQARGQGRHGVRAVAVGPRITHGAATSSDGLVINSAAKALLALLTSEEELMVDFSLFDKEGCLLLGRAGIEIWAKEVTDARQQQVLPPPQEPLLVHAMFRHLHSVAATAAAAPVLPRGPAGEAAVAAAAAAAGPPPPPLHFTRTVRQLHFLVDGVEGQALWDTGITLDAEARPLGWTGASTARMRCSWSNMLGLLGVTAQAVAEGVDGDADALDFLVPPGMRPMA